jgi:hypothetical protein
MQEQEAGSRSDQKHLGFLLLLPAPASYYSAINDGFQCRLSLTCCT